jgi:hypothetical protein
VLEKPALEATTFVPALILELLEPIARETRLLDVLDRTRRYLRDQVEESGLVRYYGRPGATYIKPFVGTITPDADDTALVWRVAPPEQPARLRSALRTLATFRADSGLYRTWLVPSSDSACIPPGRDPNPTDVVMNMHLYLFFVRYDPAAGRRLCEALQSAVGEDRIWVWYEVAPLIPLLREVDLAHAGCPLRVPAERFPRAPAGQDRYLALGRLYRALLLPEDVPPPVDTVVGQLMSLAADDFRVLRDRPPLLYSGDSTTRYAAFYWSEDFGYALWLRVLFAAARRYPEALGPAATLTSR